MTAKLAKPFVLHVDDDPDDLSSWKLEVESQARVEIGMFHPDEVTADDLKRASLVLVDFKLEHWPNRAAAPSLTLRPANGLALLSVLQEAAYDLDKDSPRAFALFTAEMKLVARGLVPQPHIVSRAHNLEWVFDKVDTPTATRAQLTADLAETVFSLPRPWPGDTPEHAATALKKWLAIPEAAVWAPVAWQSITRCYPPIHEFAEHTHGIGVLRWALHRIWPYPTFLLDDAHVAARLRVDPASLRKQLAANEKLRLLLEPAQYKGPLSTFLGRRWWRAGLESTIFSLASDDPASLSVLHSGLKLLAPDLQFLKADTVFPVLDERFVVTDRLASPDEVVEVMPDDWPPFADSAWALKSDVDEHPRLAAIAVPVLPEA